MLARCIVRLCVFKCYIKTNSIYMSVCVCNYSLVRFMWEGQQCMQPPQYGRLHKTTTFIVRPSPPCDHLHNTTILTVRPSPQFDHLHSSTIFTVRPSSRFDHLHNTTILTVRPSSQFDHLQSVKVCNCDMVIALTNRKYKRTRYCFVLKRYWWHIKGSCFICGVF